MNVPGKPFPCGFMEGRIIEGGGRRKTGDRSWTGGEYWGLQLEADGLKLEVRC